MLACVAARSLIYAHVRMRVIDRVCARVYFVCMCVCVVCLHVRCVCLCLFVRPVARLFICVSGVFVCVFVCICVCLCVGVFVGGCALLVFA